MMYVWLFLLVFLPSCKKETESSIKAESTPSCSVKDEGNRLIVTCPDGSTGTISDGEDGKSGSNGTDGKDGSNGQDGFSIVTLLGPSNSCSNGGVTLIIGKDVNRSGVLELAEDSNIQSVDICNGQDGTSAPVSQLTPVGIINPCGDAPNLQDEVFLKLQNGTILTSISENANGKNTRLSFLTQGTYITTDGDNCRFTIDSVGNISNESHSN